MSTAFLALSVQDRKLAFDNAALGLQLEPVVLEKDFWVSWLLGLIRCAANLAVQGRVKSADGKAVLTLGFSAGSAAVRCTDGLLQWVRHRNFPQSSLETTTRPPTVFWQCLDISFGGSCDWTRP